jgi:hypothetical protein
MSAIDTVYRILKKTAFGNTSHELASELIDAVEGGGTPGSGDVVGPDSSTDGHLAVFNGTTGKLIKDGGAVPGGGGATIESTTNLIVGDNAGNGVASGFNLDSESIDVNGAVLIKAADENLITIADGFFWDWENTGLVLQGLLNLSGNNVLGCDTIFKGESPSGINIDMDGILRDSAEKYSIEWENRYLADSANENVSLDWNARTLNDTNNAEVVNWDTVLKLALRSDPPDPPAEGMIYADTDHHLYYYNGTAWKQLDNTL